MEFQTVSLVEWFPVFKFYGFEAASLVELFSMLKFYGILSWIVGSMVQNILILRYFKLHRWLNFSRS